MRLPIARELTRRPAERKVYQAYPTQALQAQQFRQLCPPIEQVRFPQGPP
jgi:hypothetical protein